MALFPADLHRRPEVAGRHRAGGPGVRAAAEGGRDVEGTVSVPRREDAVVPRQPREGVLPLLRLRRRRRRLQVPRAAREGRLPGRGAAAGAARSACRSGAGGLDGRTPTSQREREALLKVHEVAAAWFREQLGHAGRRGGAAAARRTAALTAETIDDARPRVRAAGARRPEERAAEARLRAGAAARERPGRPARRRRRSSIGSATG